MLLKDENAFKAYRLACIEEEDVREWFSIVLEEGEEIPLLKERFLQKQLNISLDLIFMFGIFISLF